MRNWFSIMQISLLSYVPSTYPFLKKKKSWLFFQHQIIVHDYKIFCRLLTLCVCVCVCVCIITFLKNMAGINYFDNKPVENVKLGSFKGQP